MNWISSAPRPGWVSDDMYPFESKFFAAAAGHRMHFVDEGEGDPSHVPRIFKAMARTAGLPEVVIKGLSGNSARIGAAQDMLAAGIELPAILDAGRWKSPAMVKRYRERQLAQRSGAAQLARLQNRA